MSELLALAERCEKATGPDRELDGKVKLAAAAQLFAAGASKDEAISLLGGDLYAESLPYTASIDAAMTLVPKFLFWRKSCGRLSPSEPLYAMQLFDSENNILLSEAEAHTECGAIISAAFRLPAALRARAAATASANMTR